MTDVMLVDAAHNTAAAERNICPPAHCMLLATLARLACMCHVFGILKYRNYLSQLCHYHFKML